MPFPIGAAIGGGLGLLGGLFNGGSGMDGPTERYLKYMRSFAKNYSRSDMAPNAGIGQAMEGYRGLMGGIPLGIDTLSGDPEALKRMMGGGQGLLDTIYDRQESNGLNAVRKQLTLAGGMRSTRAGIPVGSFMSGMAGERAQGTLGLMGQAYGNANSLLNFGMGGAQGLGSLGQYLTNLPMDQARTIMQILQMGIGPQQATAGGNPLSGALGGAALGAGLFPRRGSGGNGASGDTDISNFPKLA